MRTRILLLPLTAVLLLALAPPAVAGKRCCRVQHSGNTATATGTILVPRAARILYVGMAPSVGTCRSNPRPGVVAVSKKFNLKKTVRGRYAFVVFYMHKRKVREKYSPRFLIRGEYKPRKG